MDETADIEKRMSAIENGEAILDRIHMQFEMQNKERYSSLSDDDRLLSDLENTDDESSQVHRIDSYCFSTRFEVIIQFQ